MTTSTKRPPTGLVNSRPRLTLPATAGRSPDVAPGGTLADVLRPLAEALLGRPVPIRLAFFDGSALGPDAGPGCVQVHTSDALNSNHPRVASNSRTTCACSTITPLGSPVEPEV